MKVWVASVILTVTVAGCVSAKDIARYEDRSPIPMAAGARPKTVGIQRIVSTIPQGTDVGTRQHYLACVGYDRYLWKSAELDPSVQAHYAMRLREEFRRAGYVIVGDEGVNTTGTALFQPPPPVAADLLIAAVIRRVAMNMCLPYLAFGNTRSTSGEASIEVEWQLFDPAQQRVVLTRMTGGSGKRDAGEHGTQGPLHDAFAGATRNLLGDADVAALLAGGGAR